MNRSNIWIHVGLATILVAFAAILGQMDRWRSALRQTRETTNVTTIKPMAPVTDGIPEVLVRFKPGTSLSEIRGVAAAHHDRLADEIESVPGLAVIDDLDNADPAAVAKEYSMLGDVSYAEPNVVIKLDDPIQKDANSLNDGVFRSAVEGAPNDPLFSEQWALNNQGADGGKQRADLDAIEAWQTTKGSHDVVVAVLDSGVDYTHEDLVENMWIRPTNVPAYQDDELGAVNDVNGFNADDKQSDPMDDNGHGTHCAGIIGAEGDNGIGISGINQHVKIMPLKFLGRSGSGSTAQAIEAINYVVDRKKNGVNVRIISASWGSTARSKALEDAIRAAGDAGILFVAAAGNDGSNNDRWGHYPSNYDLPNVISVAALDRADTLASFSNFGVKTVHLAAPGKAILSTWLKDGYREASGTSMATPYVSGIAALVVANEPSISMTDLRKRILSTVDKLPVLDGKVSSGGRVCAANALAGRATNHLPQ
jgi:subtilisin family serine protease